MQEDQNFVINQMKAIPYQTEINRKVKQLVPVFDSDFTRTMDRSQL
jgi:hypothetical protein